MDLLLGDDTTTKDSSSKILEEVHETKNGSMKIAYYGAWKYKKVDKCLKCVATDCLEVFSFVKDINDHLWTVHPNIKFKCKYCPKVYFCNNSWNKHEASHFELRYRCHFYTKWFQFPNYPTSRNNLKENNEMVSYPCVMPLLIGLTIGIVTRKSVMTVNRDCMTYYIDHNSQANTSSGNKVLLKEIPFIDITTNTEVQETVCFDISCSCFEFDFRWHGLPQIHFFHLVCTIKDIFKIL